MAIRATRDIKRTFTVEDVRERAIRAALMASRAGTTALRTHVDVDPIVGLAGIRGVLEAREVCAGLIDIQIVAFPQEGILSYPNGLELLEESLRLGADVVGAIPHFEFTRELGVESLHKAIDLAKRYDLPVDVHCDEIDDEQSRFLETLAMLAHRDGLGARVTASHTTAMHSYNGAYTSRLFRLLKLSGINFVANPLPRDLLPAQVRDSGLEPDLILQTLRSHDQYNTTIYGLDDRYRGVKGQREVVFANEADIRRLGYQPGDKVDLVSLWSDGIERRVRRFTLLAFDIPAGQAAAYYPETNPLVPLESVGVGSHTPTSKFIAVRLEKATGDGRII